MKKVFLSVLALAAICTGTVYAYNALTPSNVAYYQNPGACIQVTLGIQDFTTTAASNQAAIVTGGGSLKNLVTTRTSSTTCGSTAIYFEP